jgi:hypothetical protein
VNIGKKTSEKERIKLLLEQQLCKILLNSSAIKMSSCLAITKPGPQTANKLGWELVGKYLEGGEVGAEDTLG